MAIDRKDTDVRTLTDDDVRRIVREKYGDVAKSASSCCEPAPAQSGCCGGAETPSLTDLGYSADQASRIPDGADLGLGCGNPLAHAGLRAGETVLDLGSGAGIDAFLASDEVGDGGRVIGVDMTHEMLQRARANAVKVGKRNVEFRLGEIEHLPVADNSVDAVISNCVINLSPDKVGVFREALRVLKPGGRAVVSDIVLDRPLPEDVAGSAAAYVGCIAGASLREDYVRLMRQAGFVNVEIVDEHRYGCGADTDAVRSVKVRGWKHDRA